MSETEMSNVNDTNFQQIAMALGQAFANCLEMEYIEDEYAEMWGDELNELKKLSSSLDELGCAIPPVIKNVLKNLSHCEAAKI